jgi:hypothetical protein
MFCVDLGQRSFKSTSSKLVCQPFTVGLSFGTHSLTSNRVHKAIVLGLAVCQWGSRRVIQESMLH